MQPAFQFCGVVVMYLTAAQQTVNLFSIPTAASAALLVCVGAVRLP